MKALSPPVSRALALAVLIVALAGLYFGIIAPLADGYSATRDSIAQLEDSLQRYQRAANELAPRQAELAALKQRQPAQEGFLQGSNDTLVAAQIQNRIKSLADAAHSELRSTQVLAAQDEGKLKRITVRSQMSATIVGVQRVIYGLESAMPMLFLDNVDLRARPADPRDRSGATADTIDVQFDVYGYTKPSG